MFIFIAIAIASFIFLAGSFLFGHEHDMDHADVGHVGEGHDIGHDAEPAISFFSVKVIATLIMGFGAAGAIATHYGADYLVSSLIGIASGLVISLAMYGMLKVVYGQQATSLMQTTSVVGQTGIVTTSIGEMGLGEVGLTFGGQYLTYIARSESGGAIPKGTSVRVVNVVGSELVVTQHS